MQRLEKIAQSAKPSTGVQFRESAYGTSGALEFLRDVMAMANAEVDRARYIVVGIAIDEKGNKQIHEISGEDFSGEPSYTALANEYIEPAFQIEYHSVVVDGKQIGVFEITNCEECPYMMRVDHSKTLRRGDAYQRVNNAAIKMGRRRLQSMFEAKFRESVPEIAIEIGFPGDIIHKDLEVEVCDLSELPSAVAGAKIKQLIDFLSDNNRSPADTMVARLTHARLFGSDSTYVDRSLDELVEDMRQIEREYEVEDEQFLFGENGKNVQLVVYNQGEETIRGALLSIAIPNHAEFHVAKNAPKVPTDDEFELIVMDDIDKADSPGRYPSVSLNDKAVKVVDKLGDIPPGEFVDVFDVPLRLCVGDGLQGKRFGMQYSLTARNMRTPAKGKLRLIF